MREPPNYGNGVPNDIGAQLVYPARKGKPNVILVGKPPALDANLEDSNAGKSREGRKFTP